MRTILVVDDEPNYLVVLSEILREEGFEVFTAESGNDGLPIVRDADLDLVVSDMKMPGMDGIQFLENIKKINRQLPVILITAYAEVEKAVEAMRLGAFNYIAKPFSNEALLASVSKAIEHHSMVREITYEEMSHQASDWTPENLKATDSKPATKPVRLNFKVAKQNRIHWIRRSMHQ